MYRSLYLYSFARWYFTLWFLINLNMLLIRIVSRYRNPITSAQILNDEQLYTRCMMWLYCGECKLCTVFNANKIRMDEQNAMDLVKWFENQCDSRGIRLSDFHIARYLYICLNTISKPLFSPSIHSTDFRRIFFSFNYIWVSAIDALGWRKNLIVCVLFEVSVKPVCHIKFRKMSLS